LSNIESDERKELISKLVQLLKTNEYEFLIALLADRFQELVQDEKVAKDTIKTVATKKGMKVK
jgi:hypothetical protein